MSAIVLYYDYVDPASLLMERRVRAAATELGLGVDARPFEVRPPGERAVDASAPGWVEWWERIIPELEALGFEARLPTRVPRTRKAHELLRLARERTDSDVTRALHDRLWVATLQEGRDIGRIDQLVDLATEHGLDLTETRAVLDVDRHAETIDAIRTEAIEAGVRGVPSVLFGGGLMEGVHPEPVIREFLTVPDTTNG